MFSLTGQVGSYASALCWDLGISVDKTISTLAGQASIPFAKVHWAPCVGWENLAFPGSLQPFQESEVIIQGNKWDHRVVPGSWESPQDVPELYWGDEGGSLRKWREPELSFQGHVGRVGCCRQELIRSSSIHRTSGQKIWLGADSPGCRRDSGIWISTWGVQGQCWEIIFFLLPTSFPFSVIPHSTCVNGYFG